MEGGSPSFIRTGIEGLDEMMPKGLPKRSLIAIIGEAGTGKTTFALQFLLHGVQNGQKGTFITLEQTRDSLFQTASSFGWDLRTYDETGDMVVVGLDPDEMAANLAGIRNELTRMCADFGAERLVLDSISHLEMMFDDSAERRNEIYRFSESLKESGVTALVTSEATLDGQFSSRYNIIEYTADAVILQRYIRDDPETRLGLEIMKIRKAPHSREIKPYEITEDGIDVHFSATLF